MKGIVGQGAPFYLPFLLSWVPWIACLGRIVMDGCDDGASILAVV